MSTPVTEASSNTVLFNMMLHFREQVAVKELENTRMRELLAAQQQRIHELSIDNRTLTTANIRGANLVNMKHEAGMMFAQCTDRFADLAGTMRREIPEVTAFCPEIERILLRADFAHHMLHGVNFVDLTADEDIDTELESDDEGVEL